MTQQAPWSIEQDVREDADSVFVPCDRLSGAGVGDLVEVGSAHAGRRCGRITAIVEDRRRGSFYTIQLDAPSV
jgi:hypothetical protein